MKQLQKGLYFILLFANYLTLTFSISSIIVLRFINLDMSETRFFVEFWGLFVWLLLSALGLAVCAKVEKSFSEAE